MQQVEPLSRKLSLHKRDAGDIATGVAEAGDKARLDRVDGDIEDDRNCRGYRFGRDYRSGTRGDHHRHPALDQIGGQRRQSIVLTFRPAVFDD
jgi:hypothetical protein